MKSFIKYLFILIVLAATFSSCKKQDEKIGGGALNFSADTIFFDTTVFTGIKTITKRVTVYNFNTNAVTIDEISIPENSPFSLIIDGRKTNSLKNHVLRGNDKLLILLEANLEHQDYQDSILIVQEHIKFITNGEQQQVVLVAPGLDVYFHNDEVLGCNETWKSDYPHVIYNSVLVPAGCKLTIEPGTKIYSHSRSAIFVEGTLEAIGTSDDRIIFTDDRLESNFNELYGIWEGILFLPGSSDNVLDWIHISNSVNGLYINTESPNDGNIDVRLEHSIINSVGNNSSAPSLSAQDFGIYTGFGVFAANSHVSISNCLIENCTVGSVFFLLNGSYYLLNNTFTNYPVNLYNRPKDVRTMYASSVTFYPGTSIVRDAGALYLQMFNNIIYGENSDPEPENNLDELLLTLPTYIEANNNIIKTADSTIMFILDTAGVDNILNTTPFDYGGFEPEDDDFELRLGSNAIDVGIKLPNDQLPVYENLNIDLNGENKGPSDWDIGAYEYVE